MPGDLFRPAIADLIPYEPGKPVEEVQRELGLDRVVKLASNEGQFGPFPAALAALERGLPGLNRYPDGGAYRLVMRLSERHGVEPSNVAVAAGADAIIAYLSLAALDPGDEVVFGWPSFASYPLASINMGATPVRVSPIERPAGVTKASAEGLAVDANGASAWILFDEGERKNAAGVECKDLTDPKEQSFHARRIAVGGP